MSITSLKITRNSAISRHPVAENANLPHSSRSRFSGSSPRIQNFRPSRLSIGKTKRPVYAHIRNETAVRFSRLMPFWNARPICCW